MKKEEDIMEQYLEEEFEKEARETLKEVEKDEKLDNVQVPEEMYQQLLVKITAFEHEHAAGKDESEDSEIHKYRRRRRFVGRKTFGLVAAVAVIIIGAGITSVGGPKYLLETVNQMLDENKEMTKMNTKGSEVLDSEIATESQTYEKIEKELRFVPVKFNYWPEGIVFKNGEIIEELYSASLEYDYHGTILMYRMQANYTKTSYAFEIEDVLLDEWQITLPETTVKMKEYEIRETGQKEYSAEFYYMGVNYFLTGIIPREEFEKIIQNLKFL